MQEKIISIKYSENKFVTTARPSCIENLAFSLISTFSICDRISPPEDDKQACQGRNIIIANNCTSIIRQKNDNYNWSFLRGETFTIKVRLWNCSCSSQRFFQRLEQMSLLVAQVFILQCLLVPPDVRREKQKLCRSF